MHLSDLLHTRVVDADGRDIGSVDDVHLEQDGPMLLPFGAAFRVVGVVVGHRAVGRRLGYRRTGVRGPAIVKRAFFALERRSRYVEWRDVAEWDGETVTLTRRYADLRPVERDDDARNPAPHT
jgi:hypothetical protein